MDIYDIQFTDNTPEEAAEARRQVMEIVAAKDAEISRLLNALELIDHMNAGYVSELAREARRKVLDGAK